MSREFRYALIEGGERRVELSEQDLTSMALDARLSARLDSLGDVELAGIGARVRQMFGESNLGFGCALQKIGEVQGATLHRFAGGDRLVGVSPIGEAVVLRDQQRWVTDVALGEALLRWTCGRVHPAVEPIGVVVLPVGGVGDYLSQVLSELTENGVRVEVRNDASLSRRLRRFWVEQIPVAVVVGAAEAAGSFVQIRRRGSVESVRSDLTGLKGVLEPIFKIV